MPWECNVCTLVNTDDNSFHCNLCGRPKGTPDPDEGNEAMKHMSLRAILKAGPEAFNAEIQETKRLQALKEVKGVFGVVLNTETPVVVCDCIAFIRAQGMYTEGVFRIPGQQDMVDALKHRYSDEKIDDVLNSMPCEVHDVATLLKSYFRWLPEPLVPKESYEAILRPCRSAHLSKAELESAVFSALHRIQSPNKECMSFLITFLREVAEFEKYNKMNPANLATCFAPSLLRAPDDVSPEQALMDMTAAIGVLVVLIRSKRDLFVPSKEQIKGSTRHKPKGAVAPPPGLEKEKRRSSRKTFSLTKTFSLGRRGSKDKDKDPSSSGVKAPPGLGPKDGKTPPPVPSRKEQPPPRPARPSKTEMEQSSGSSKKATRKKSKVPSSFNIDDKI